MTQNDTFTCAILVVQEQGNNEFFHVLHSSLMASGKPGAYLLGRKERMIEMAEKKKAVQEEVLKGKVIGGSLNIRKKPDKNSAVESVLKNGEEIVILEAGDEWHKVRKGYVMAAYVELLK